MLIDDEMLLALRRAEAIIADHVAGIERSAWPEVLGVVRSAIAHSEEYGDDEISCPVGDPGCLGGDDQSHDACEAPE